MKQVVTNRPVKIHSIIMGIDQALIVDAPDKLSLMAIRMMPSFNLLSRANPTPNRRPHVPTVPASATLMTRVHNVV